MKRKSPPVILLVDDDPVIMESVKVVLDGQFRILTCPGGYEALKKISEEEIDLVFLDVRMPDIDGLETLRKIKDYDNNIAVVMVTADDSARPAIEAIRLGACDYITKPFDIDELSAVAHKAIEGKKLLKEIKYLRGQIKKVRFDNIIGESANMREIYGVIQKLTKNDATVLIQGETGTGKELISRAIHFNGERHDKPFVAINCAAIPENLLESELFGYERGAFTDAMNQKSGMLETANDGTVFLDEISDLKLDMQAKLLRALEEKEIKRLGGTKTIRVDVRIIAATNTDLKKAVREKKFREDLYYRLNIVPMYMPPLRERKEDIPLLLSHFLRHYNGVFKKKIRSFTAEALECLTNYEWPGNVRELKNIVERAAALNESCIIDRRDLPIDICVKNKLDFLRPLDPEGTLENVRRDFEKKYIKTVLEYTEGNQSEASRILGIHRNSLLNKMKRLDLAE
jgi:two-component system, NtrC family, response regulator AtoC